MFGSGISKEEHENVKAKVQELSQQLRQQQQVVSKWKQEAATKSRSLERAQDKAKSSQAKVVELESKLSAVSADLASARESGASSASLQKKLREAEASLQQEKARTALKMKKLQEKVESKKNAATDVQARLELDVEERDETIAAQQRELDIFQKRVSELETECEEWEGKLANVEDSFKGDALDGRYQALEKELYEKTVRCWSHRGTCVLFSFSVSSVSLFP